MSRALILLLILPGLFSASTLAGTCSDLLVGRIDRLAAIAWLPPVPQSKWQISNLDPHYSGEDLAASSYHSELPEVLRHLPIYYFDSEEINAARVVIKSGQVFRLNGDRLQKIYGMEYIMEPNGEILIMPHYSDPRRGDHRLKHSSLSHGGPVAASGHISFNENGEVIRIDRFSGHYKPSRLQLKQFIDQIKSLGVNLSRAEINWN